MKTMRYNESKLEILQMVENLGTVTSDDIALYTNRTQKNSSMLLMIYYRYGLLSRERIRKSYNYTITPKGIDRITYLLNVNQGNML